MAFGTQSDCHGVVFIYINLAKLDDGLAESPTVMVVDKTKNRTFLAKIGAYLNPFGLSSRPI
jgi:hypothetical protein